MKWLAIVAAILVVLALSGLVYINAGVKEGAAVDIPVFSAKNLADGEYVGKTSQGRWSNQVTVYVKNGKITEIHLDKDVQFPQKDLAEKIFVQVMQKQTTGVDVVAGATITSKAYLQSIANAIK